MPHSPSAPGIPSRSTYGKTEQFLPGQLADYVVQLHDALRAGRHYDVRLGTPDLGHLSWAVPKGLPSHGGKHLAIRQPLHDPNWAKFEGVIPKGQYGAGQVKKHDTGQVLITKASPKEIHFTLASKGTPQRFILTKPKPKSPEDNKNWLLINTTPTQAIPYEKVKYQSIDPKQVESVLKNLKPGSSVQAKIDGAATLARLGKRHVEVFSYRTAKETGHPIVHTERFFGGLRPESRIPKELVGTVLRGELYGLHKGKSIPPQELGGILNATIANSLQKQKDKGIELKNLLFDVYQIGKNKLPPNTPFEERKRLLQSVLPHLPTNKFHVPEEAQTSQAALKLWQSVIGGKHPLTREGIVVHPPVGKPMKIKQRGEDDVIITGFAPGKGKYTDKGIGAFTYAHPSSPSRTAGEIGTGLSDELRTDMHKDPKKYIGRTARVISQERLPSGALRAPALLAIHEG